MDQRKTVTVNVRNIAFGGDGIGEVTEQGDGARNLLGISAFVPFTAPRELVQARIVEEKDRYIRAELLSVQKPSIERVDPRCRFFGSCGGCELQHLSYDEQLRAKYEMIRGALTAAKLSQDVLAKLLPCEPGEPYGYRRRISLHVDQAGKVGFYRPNTRSVVAVDECPISIEAFQPILKTIAAFGRSVAGKISSIILEADSKGVVAVLKAPYALGAQEKQAILNAAREYFESCLLIAGDEEGGGFGRQILELPLSESGGVCMLVPAGNFSQVNWEVNQKILERVLGYVEPERQGTVLDLYAGAGNFSIPLARDGFKVQAVEVDRRLVSLGRQAAAKYRLEKNLQFIESSVEKFLASAPKKIDCLIADPPRSGLKNLVSALPKTRRMILVSCHLASFVRDLKALVQQGYVVEEIQAFDMFAQTSYTEIVSHLTKNV